MINWDDLVGEEEVRIHLHGPKTKKAGFPVYSVNSREGKALGHTTGGALVEPRVHVNAFQFVQAINHPKKAKTRNTFIVGKPVASLPEEGAQPVQVRTGRVSVGGKPVFEVPTEEGDVRLRENIPSRERTPGGPGTRLGAPFRGRVVPQGAPTRSGVFASGIIFGKHGISAIDPIAGE